MSGSCRYPLAVPGSPALCYRSPHGEWMVRASWPAPLFVLVDCAAEEPLLIHCTEDTVARHFARGGLLLDAEMRVLESVPQTLSRERA